MYRTIPTRVIELVRAIAPGLKLNTLLFLVMAFTDSLTGGLRTTDPLLYLLIMVIPAPLVYLTAFLLLPIPALQSESVRWRQKITVGLNSLYKSLT